MADVKIYFPKVLQYAGGYVNDPIDRGGATKYDVTLDTWRAMGHDKDGDGDIDANDIKLLTPDDAMTVMKVGYWDRWRADSIKNQSVAESLVEWVWGSGKWGIVIPQRILGVTADGRVGVKTITAINNCDQAALHEKLRLAKIKFLNDIVAGDTKQQRFIKGWTRRVNEFEYA